MIVVDEIHTCKNSSSKQGSNLLKLNKAKYIIGAIYQISGKMAPHIKAITGTLALQGINDVVIKVISLSLLFSIILVDMIPGTVHPEDIKNGIIMH